ncbi:MAG: glycoside hydrolase family 3 C-terminal domain-containing protein, partial [Acidobacteriaceae bacterium]|nr:glycoside hydrolase family 3 C-terminal domain-containing protein [Acidobacteriaceae bacterium]
AVNPRTIVVLVASYPYSIQWVQEHVPSILTMSHSGGMQGAALAEILFGDSSPSGHLTVTWPESITQLPAMMDYNIRRGRTYMYFKHGKPLYAFGHGLSYTAFRYSDVHVSGDSLSAQVPVTVEATVTNTGQRSGDEVAQLYIQHLGSQVERAKMELKGFQRLSLKPGESGKVSFRLAAADVAYWDTKSESWTVEKDRIKLMVGGASDRIGWQQEIDVLP